MSRVFNSQDLANKESEEEETFLFHFQTEDRGENINKGTKVQS